MELEYLRKIHENSNGYFEMTLPKEIVRALGTRNVLIRVKDKHLEVIPRKKGSELLVVE